MSQIFLLCSFKFNFFSHLNTWISAILRKNSKCSLFSSSILFFRFEVSGLFCKKFPLRDYQALHFGEANIWQMVENRAISNENEKQERNIQCFIYTANQSFDSKHFKVYDVHLIFRKHSASSFFLFQ